MFYIEEKSYISKDISCKNLPVNECQKREHGEKIVIALQTYFNWKPEFRKTPEASMQPY